MALKVRTIWLVGPIIITFLLLISTVMAMNYFNVEQATTGYDYKEKLFKENEVGTIEITLRDENWQKILDDPTAEEYVEGSIKVNGETYENVGIRAKGNSSLTSIANSDSERYSLKIDFAQYDTNQTFYGLETINLNNNFSDTTQMKEFVSYELMEQLGVATPAHAYVKVMVNGEYYGLMLAVEEIGEAFAKTNFGSTEGFLFKPEGNGSDLAYVSDNVDDYSGIFDEVKMNKKTAENTSNVVTMMKEISEGDTSSLNIDQIARYFALNTALVNMDSYQGSFKHNYYLYENNDGIFSVVPWDYNMAFGGFNMGGGRPQGAAIDERVGVQNELEENKNVDSQMNNQMTSPNDGNGQAASLNNANGQMVPPTNEANQATPPNNVNGQMTPPDNGMGQVNGQVTSPNNGPGQMQPPNQANGQMQRPPTNGEQNVENRNTQGNGNRPAMNGGGGGMMLNETIVTDTSVNFSITEPVSGTTIDARPLLKIILEDEEARALYDQYLEKIATEILTEENVLAITTKLYDLLLNAVEEDPSKFSTTEQFIAGVSGDQSLPEFAKQRSESILKQLSGEIEGITGAGASFGGDMNGEMPNFENMPEMNGEMPNFENMPEMNGENPNVGNMPDRNGQMPAQGAMSAEQNEKNTQQTAILLIVSFVLVLLAICVVQVISRKKYSRR